MGAAGCFLEDQEWPKRCGHMEGKRVVPLDEYLPKLRAALDLRRGTAFHVTARTDARAVVGLDEALRARPRLRRCGRRRGLRRGAAVGRRDGARARGGAGTVPLVANMVEQGKTPLRPAAELAAAGYPIVVVPVAGVLAAAHALRAVYGALARDGASGALAERMLGFAELNQLLGLAGVLPARGRVAAVSRRSADTSPNRSRPVGHLQLDSAEVNGANFQCCYEEGFPRSSTISRTTDRALDPPTGPAEGTSQLYVV